MSLSRNRKRSSIAMRRLRIDSTTRCCLLAAQRDAAALSQLETLARDPESAAVALRLLGLIEFQDGKLDAAGGRFTELLTPGKFVDDSFYYLGLIAERRRRRAASAAALCSGAERRQRGAGAVARLRAFCRPTAPRRRPRRCSIVSSRTSRSVRPEILAARAEIYADAGDAQQAMQVLDGGEREYPDSVEMRYAIASTYEEQGRVGAALRGAAIVLDSRPDDPAALNAYGYTLADHRLQLVARACLDRARLCDGSEECRDSR